MSSKIRSNIRFENEIYTQIVQLKEREGFDTFIETVKFLIRLAIISSSNSGEELPLLTYENRFEQTISFHSRFIQYIDDFPFDVKMQLSRNDKINYLCFMGLKEYKTALVQFNEGGEHNEK